MRLTELFDKALSLSEARVPGLDYKDIYKGKKEPVLDKVILTLRAKDSEIMTKLALKYKNLDNLEKAIKKRRDTMNATVKEKMDDLFDAEDIWQTRVIETVSATMTLAKRSEKTAAIPPRVETQIDWQNVAAELLELLEGDLIEKGKQILQTYTKVVRIAGVPEKEPPSPALRVEPTTDDAKEKVKAESISEGVNWGSIKDWANKFLGYFNSWGKAYDKKLANITASLTESIELSFEMPGTELDEGSPSDHMAEVAANIKEVIDSFDMSTPEHKSEVINYVHGLTKNQPAYEEAFVEEFEKLTGGDIWDYISAKKLKDSKKS